MTLMLAYVLIAAMLVGAGLWVYHGLRFRKRLEDRHTLAVEEYAQRSHVAYSHARGHFARPRGYRSLGDAELARDGDRARLGSLVFSLGLAGLLALHFLAP